MKRTSLSIVALGFIFLTHAYAEDRAPIPLSVETDHGGNPSNISTDEIVLKFSDGTTEFLTKNGCMERVPVLSPDNSAIAFLRRLDSNEDGSVNWDDEVELWLMRLENRAESRLAPILRDPSQATWHPSKMRLAFVATGSEGERGLYSYDLESKSLSLLATDAQGWPAWSPTGAQIAFYDNENRVVVVSTKEKKTKILSPDVGNSWALYWSLDGRLVFSQEVSGWYIFTPRSEEVSPLNAAQRKKLTFIDQEKFGWATIMAEQVDAPKR